jgi:hypothetical protein
MRRDEPIVQTGAYAILGAGEVKSIGKIDSVDATEGALIETRDQMRSIIDDWSIYGRLPDRRPPLVR